MSSCFHCTNPFNTRSPEPPDPGDNTLSFGVQTTPDSLLIKLQRSFRPDGVMAYRECMSDSLVFTPEQDEADRLVNWNSENEAQYFASFIRADTLQQAELRYTDDGSFSLTPDPLSPRRVQAEFSYQIVAEFNQSTQRYQGRTVLLIEKSAESELWFIKQWQDFKLNEDQLEATWSSLRAEYQ